MPDPFVEKLMVTTASAAALVSFWVLQLSVLSPSMKYQNTSISRLSPQSLSSCHHLLTALGYLCSLIWAPSCMFGIFFLIVYLLHINAFTANIPKIKSRHNINVLSQRRRFLFTYIFSSSVMNRCYFIFRPTGTTTLGGMNCTIYLSTVLIQGSSIHRLELKKDQPYKSYL